MTSIREAVAQSIAELSSLRQWEDEAPADKKSHRLCAHIAIEAFLEAAAERGWHMRPDEPRAVMVQSGLDAADGYGVKWTPRYGPEPIERERYRAMVKAAPPFEWDKE